MFREPFCFSIFLMVFRERRSRLGIVSLPLHEYSSSLPAAPDSGRTPGREKDFLRLGYAVEAFPSTQDASCLDDAEPEELPLHAYAPGLAPWRPACGSFPPCFSGPDACRSPLAEGGSCPTMNRHKSAGTFARRRTVTAVARRLWKLRGASLRLFPFAAGGFFSMYPNFFSRALNSMESLLDV